MRITFGSEGAGAEHLSLMQEAHECLTTHRSLLWQLARRDIVGRYRGSWLGIGWSLLTPLLMLIVYSFVFGIVFKARFGGTIDHPGAFAIMLYAGLLVHGIMAECLTRSPTVIVSQVNFVKKVVFPLTLLPIVPIISSLVHFCLGLGILLIGVAWVWGNIPITLLYVPIILLPYVMLCLGLAWGLASVGVFLRDIAHITGLLATVLLFLSPVFYSIEMLPEFIRSWVYLNPLTLIIESLRSVAIKGEAPDWQALGVYSVLSFSVMLLGAWWFLHTRKGFADVL